MKLGETLATLVAVFACNATFAEPSCQITDFGIAEAGELVRIVDEAGAASGKVRYVKSGVIVKQTDHIPARLGLRFGVKHEFKDVPPDGGLQVVVNHPPMKNAAGDLQTISKGPKNPKDVGFYYGFDRPAELLAGQWVFQFMYNSKLLCEKTFTVYLE